MKFNFQVFKIKSTNKLLVLSIFLFCLLAVSVLKNISYPLFWADESMTAIGAERVLEYGYPKVHDGKNVFYDLRNSNPTLGINAKDDSYIGGAGWGQYYYGVIGYMLADKIDNIYFKTGVFRATFALVGLIGLLLFAFFLSKFFPDKFNRYLFISLFFLLELMSISLALLLREVRYYSLVIFLSSIIIGLYLNFRFYKPFNKFLFVSIEILSLCLLFVTFAPVFFISILTIGLSELIIGVFQYSKSDLRSSIKKVLPVMLSLIISLIIISPLVFYFKTFEISNAMSAFNGFNSKMYWNNMFTSISYFAKHELLWLALIMKLLLILNSKNFLMQGFSLFKISCFLTLFFIVSLFTIAKIPNFIFTRYIIYLQPILSIIVILDFLILLDLNSENGVKCFGIRNVLPLIIFCAFFIYLGFSNFKNIKSHIFELTHIYKGPLDYTIPFIKESFKKTDTLVIAANYEETSYMYYLKSKVVVGLVGNNILEDAKLNPHIIAFRSTWTEFAYVFDEYGKRAVFNRFNFSVFDFPFNNIPELNSELSMPHQFETKVWYEQDGITNLYLRK